MSVIPVITKDVFNRKVTIRVSKFIRVKKGNK